MVGHLFANSPVNLEDPVVLRNLSEPEAGKILFDSFKKAVNALTVQDAGASRIVDYIRLRDTRPFRTENRPYLAPKKSLFSKIVGEPHTGGFELRFARFLDDVPDVVAFAKNYLAVGFKIDYVKADGDLSNYVPDFLVKTTDGAVWIVETKGREEMDSAAEDGPAQAVVRGCHGGKSGAGRAGLPLRVRRSSRFRGTPTAGFRRPACRLLSIPKLTYNYWETIFMGSWP